MQEANLQYVQPIQGIYLIENTRNGKCYIGSTVNLVKRWCQHKSNCVAWFLARALTTKNGYCC